VATPQDKDEMNDVLEQALIVIDERDFERSLRDPRVRALHKSGARLQPNWRLKALNTAERESLRA
jgi:hypothetical protein